MTEGASELLGRHVGALGLVLEPNFRRADAVRALLIGRLTGQIDELTSSVLVEVERTLAPLDDLAASCRPEVQETMHWIVSVILQCWDEHRVLRPRERARLQAFGEAAVDAAGVPIAVIGACLRSCRGVVWRRVTAELPGLVSYGTSLPTAGAFAVVANLADELAEVVDDLSACINGGYDTATSARRRLSRRVADLLADILAGEYPTEADAVLDAGKAGVDFAAPMSMLVVAARPGPGGRARLEQAATRVRSSDPAYLIVPGDSRAQLRHLALVKPYPRAELRVATAPRLTDATVAVARHGLRGPGALRDGYLGAVADVRLALVAAPERHGVVGATEVGFLRILAEASEQRQLEVIRPIQPLLELRNAQELLATLAALLRSRGLAVPAARALGAHRNTVAIRMAQIQSVTGLRLDDSDHLLQLSHAVAVYRIRQERARIGPWLY